MVLNRIMWSLVLFVMLSCKPGGVIPHFHASYDRPTNVILVIADGMGVGHLSGATFMKKRDRLISAFPVVGIQKTFAKDDLITDSAASATAMACGIKTYVGAIGVDTNGLPKPNLIEKSADLGMATGIVVSSSIVHGTPACFYAHRDSRLQLEEIALDLVKTAPDFVVGGGKYYFTARNDGRNLVTALDSANYQVFDFFNTELHAVNPSTSSKFCYFTAEREPLGAHFGRTFLPLAVSKALRYLSRKSDHGFFLMVEASQLDWASHNKNEDWLYNELRDFRDVLSVITRFAEKDGNTLVLVTGDHETGGAAIGKRSRPGLPRFEFSSNDHTGEMIPLLAMGPGAKYFSGIYDNTEIHDKIWSLLQFIGE